MNGGRSNNDGRACPAHRKGLVGSFQQMGFGLGILLGTVFALLVNSLLDEPARAAWGWHLPFALVAPLAIYIRRHVDETPEFTHAAAIGNAVRAPVRVAFNSHWRLIIAVIGIGALGTAARYIANQFMSAFSVRSLGLPAVDVSAAITAASLLLQLLIPFWGWLSDRIGGLTIIGGAALLYTLCMLPLMSMLGREPSLIVLSTVLCLSAVLVSASFGPLPALISSFFSVEVRTTAVSIGYNLAAAFFGGLAPFTSTWLVNVTGQLVAPAYYGILCGVTSTVACAICYLTRQASRKMRPVTYRNPSQLFRPTGPWSILAEEERLIFLAGLRGIDPTTNQLVPDPVERVRQVFRNLQLANACAGSGLDSAMRLTVFVTDMKLHRPPVNDVQQELWGEGPYPPRTILQVSALNQEDFVEVEATLCRAR